MDWCSFKLAREAVDLSLPFDNSFQVLSQYFFTCYFDN
jgi:hypothetical protein